MEEEIVVRGVTEYFKPFPEAHIIFDVDMNLHSEHLMPLCTLDLNYFNPDWVGVCPVVAPVEPCGEGLFAENAKGKHTYYCRENWIGYQLVGGKLRYMGDWGLFSHKENNSYYESVFEGYERAKSHYKKYGRLGPYRFREGDETWHSEKRAVELAWIGGESMEGNWASTTDFPSKNYRYRGIPIGGRWESIQVFG